MQCTICLGDDGEVVQKGCHCRDDAGAVHVSCLIEYATHKVARSNRSGWTRCDTCKSRFTGKAQLGLAEARFALAIENPADVAELRVARSDLSAALVDQGRFAEATEQAEVVLKEMIEAKGEDDSETMTVNPAPSTTLPCFVSLLA